MANLSSRLFLRAAAGVSVASITLLSTATSSAQEAPPARPGQPEAKSETESEPESGQEEPDSEQQAHLALIPPIAIGQSSANTQSEPEKAQPPPRREIEPRRSRMHLSGAPGSGVTLRIDDSYSLNIKSRMQLRYQLNASRPEPSGSRTWQQLATLGTARVWLSGNVLTSELTYVLQLALAARDYRDEARSPVYDAYLDYRWRRDFNLRAGQFFVPFDRLRTIREWALQLPDRPRPVQELTLDRDVGLMAYSDRLFSETSPLAFKAGIFGGGGGNLTTGDEPGALLVARLELRPLGPIDDDVEGDLERRARPGLALGAAVARNEKTNRLRSTTGPRFAGGTTDYTHLAADAVFKWRGLGLEVAYLYKEASTDEIVSFPEDGDSVVEFTRSGHGFVAQMSHYFAGGLEVVGRYSRMWTSRGTDPTFVAEIEQRGQELGTGLNYYLNGHKLKFQAGWGAFMPPAHFEQADHVAQLQVDVTF